MSTAAGRKQENIQDICDIAEKIRSRPDLVKNILLEFYGMDRIELNEKLQDLSATMVARMFKRAVYYINVYCKANIRDSGHLDRRSCNLLKQITDMSREQNAKWNYERFNTRSQFDPLEECQVIRYSESKLLWKGRLMKVEDLNEIRQIHEDALDRKAAFINMLCSYETPKDFNRSNLEDIERERLALDAKYDKAKLELTSIIKTYFRSMEYIALD